MQLSALPVLLCPWCRSADAVSALQPRPAPAVLTVGRLVCSACGRVTEVRDQVWDARADLPALRAPAQLTNLLAPVARGYEPLWRKRSLGLLSRSDYTLSDELDQLLAAINPRPDGVYLDVAASAGLYARAVAGRAPGATVIEIDHSPAFAREAVRAARRDQVSVTPVLAGAQLLPIADASCTGAMMGGSLNEIGDAGRALAEIARVLEPDAPLFCMSLVRAQSRAGQAVQAAVGPSGIQFWTRQETEELFTRAGLHVHDAEQRGVVLVTTARRAAG